MRIFLLTHLAVFLWSERLRPDRQRDRVQRSCHKYYAFLSPLDYASAQKTVRTTDVALPTRVLCFTKIGISQLAAGENHALALSKEPDTIVWSWGKDTEGQLGLGRRTKATNARPVLNLCSLPVAKVGCGSTHSVVLIRGDYVPIKGEDGKRVEKDWEMRSAADAN